MNTRQQGDIGVAAAIDYFVRKMNIVSIPFTEASDYDLIVDDGEKLQKVQVKTSIFRPRGEGTPFQVALSTKGGNRSGYQKVKHFTERNVDLLFILTGSDKKYLIPVNEINNISTINVGGKKEIYKKYLVGI